MPRPRPALIEAFVVQCERVGREHRLRPSGELDVATAPTLERALQAIDLTDAQRIIQRAPANGHEFGPIAGSVAVRRPPQLTATLQLLPFTAAPVATGQRARKYASSTRSPDAGGPYRVLDRGSARVGLSR